MYTDKILNTAYSFAAAIVVFGAWAKLEHKDFGGVALTVGMLVESGIFVIYGFMEWRNQHSPAPLDTKDEMPRELEEVKQAVQKTNSILKKVFRD
jgi:hypothetical protein